MTSEPLVDGQSKNIIDLLRVLDAMEKTGSRYNHSSKQDPVHRLDLMLKNFSTK
jgi:hypothetical protein